MSGRAPERRAPASDFAALTRQAATEQLREVDRQAAAERAAAQQARERADRERALFAATIEECAAELGRLGVRSTLALDDCDYERRPVERVERFGLLGLRKRTVIEDKLVKTGRPGWGLTLPAGGHNELVGLWIDQTGELWARSADVKIEWVSSGITRSEGAGQWSSPNATRSDDYGLPRWSVMTSLHRDGDRGYTAWVELDDEDPSDLTFAYQGWSGGADIYREPLRALLAKEVARLALEQGRLKRRGT